MAEETITTHTAPETAAPSHTTVIRERRSSGGMGIVMALVLLVAVVAGIYLFGQTSSSEAAKNNAIAEAASDVGNAASQMGNAAESAAKSVGGE